MSFILPITTPKQQLPDPAQRLSSKLVQAIGKPAGLWLPSKLAKAAADFSGNRNFGTLAGGITTTAIGWGVFQQSWKFDGTTGIGSIDFTTINTANPFTLIAAFAPNSATNNSSHAVIGIGKTAAVVDITIRANGGAYNVSDTTIVSPTTTAPASSFSLCGYTWDGTNSNIFLNGQPNGSSATAPGSTVVNKVILGDRLFISRKFAGLWAVGGVLGFAWTAAQHLSFYNALLTGSPYPLFEPTANERWIVNVDAGGPASASGAGGLIASGSLIASSLYGAIAGISSSLALVASSLRSAAAGVQALSGQFVASNLAAGAAGTHATSLEEVLTNLAAATASVQGASVEQVLTNITGGSSITGATSAEVSSSIISLLAQLQAVASQSSDITAEVAAAVAATGSTEVLTNLVHLQEALAAAATFVSSSIYHASGSLSESLQALVALNLLSVAEQIEAIAEELASSLSTTGGSGGASATVIASNLYAAAARLGSSVSVSVGGLMAGDIDATYYLPLRRKIYYPPLRSKTYYLPLRTRTFHLPSRP